MVVQEDERETAARCRARRRPTRVPPPPQDLIILTATVTVDVACRRRPTNPTLKYVVSGAPLAPHARPVLHILWANSAMVLPPLTGGTRLLPPRGRARPGIPLPPGTCEITYLPWAFSSQRVSRRREPATEERGGNAATPNAGNAGRYAQPPGLTSKMPPPPVLAGTVAATPLCRSRRRSLPTPLLIIGHPRPETQQNLWTKFYNTCSSGTLQLLHLPNCAYPVQEIAID
ncbi:hypothetical protein DAI22_02g198950 [Oryza sativa Japonica Group]|nr:hypothetical protein DAI22_02g198950 [Oryza sativa Japonica Group]